MSESGASRTVYAIDGMTCAHCEHAVTAALAALPGVDDVVVDLADGSATVRHRGTLDDLAVDAAVADAGYAVRR